jgi:hypothetical protein
MSRITSGRIKKKAGKKCVYNPADLEMALSETRQKIQYPKVHLTVSIN